ncbi:flagellar protein FliT [Modicisalibacter radicis]|uniref:flagellar protein FliT n=1 Tax=Halomonas sp. EAR18 TaxID=2518972 RepID=UPI00109CD61E|nr:flagellar protein FliT [Halomonas sp. EAR18]
MTAARDVIAEYERLLLRSTQMLGLAREGDWTRLVEEESAYVVAVENLKACDANGLLDEPGMTRKAELLERILEQDVETRRRLEARREELSELIGSNRRQFNANRAYRASATAVPIGQGRK